MYSISKTEPYDSDQRVDFKAFTLATQCVQNPYPNRKRGHPVNVYLLECGQVCVRALVPAHEGMVGELDCAGKNPAEGQAPVWQGVQQGGVRVGKQRLHHLLVNVTPLPGQPTLVLPRARRG